MVEAKKDYAKATVQNFMVACKREDVLAAKQAIKNDFDNNVASRNPYDHHPRIFEKLTNMGMDDSKNTFVRDLLTQTAEMLGSDFDAELVLHVHDGAKLVANTEMVNFTKQMLEQLDDGLPEPSRGNVYDDYLEVDPEDEMPASGFRGRDWKIA